MAVLLFPTENYCHRKRQSESINWKIPENSRRDTCHSPIKDHLMFPACILYLSFYFFTLGKIFKICSLLWFFLLIHTYFVHNFVFIIWIIFCKRRPPSFTNVRPYHLADTGAWEGCSVEVPGQHGADRGEAGWGVETQGAKDGTAGSKGGHGFSGRAREQGLEVRQPVTVAHTTWGAGRTQMLPLWAPTAPTRWLPPLPWLLPQMQRSSCKVNHAQVCSCG